LPRGSGNGDARNGRREPRGVRGEAPTLTRESNCHDRDRSVLRRGTCCHCHLPLATCRRDGRVCCQAMPACDSKRQLAVPANLHGSWVSGRWSVFESRNCETGDFASAQFGAQSCRQGRGGGDHELDDYYDACRVVVAMAATGEVAWSGTREAGAASFIIRNPT
jgi:hypothetical protein